MQQDIRKSTKKRRMQQERKQECKKTNKKMQYSSHLLCENTKYTNNNKNKQTNKKKPQKNKKKSNLICLVFCIWPHVLIHITPDIFSGKASWEESFGMPYPSWYCSAVMSWHAASIASWRDMVKNLPSPGSEKLLNGVEERGVRGKEKRDSRMGVKPGSDCTGNGGMPHCPM